MYQDFYAVDLKKQLADLYGLTVDHVCIGAGSSAIIDMLGEVFINYGDEVVYCAPTYEAFLIWSAITEVSVSFSH